MLAGALSRSVPRSRVRGFRTNPGYRPTDVGFGPGHHSIDPFSMGRGK